MLPTGVIETVSTIRSFELYKSEPPIYRWLTAETFEHFEDSFSNSLREGRINRAAAIYLIASGTF